MRGSLYEFHLLVEDKYRNIFVRAKEYEDALTQMQKIIATDKYVILSVDRKGNHE